MQRALRLLQKLPFQHIKIVRYLVSGGSAALLNFALLWGFTDLAHLWYLLSLCIAWALSSVYTFALQKFWTFEDHSLERTHIQFSQYIVLSLVNLALNSLFLFVLVEYAHLWYLAGQVMCIGALAAMNFFIYRTFIFIEKK